MCACAPQVAHRNLCQNTHITISESSQLIAPVPYQLTGIVPERAIQFSHAFPRMQNSTTHLHLQALELFSTLREHAQTCALRVMNA
jgi:hypothetical protein